MENTPTILIEPPPTPFPALPRTVDFSPLEFILALLALITVPALVYFFFFTIKCPPTPFRRGRLSSGRLSVVGPPVESFNSEEVSDSRYQKDEEVKEIESECPVCLSAFADGEEVRQLSACKHSFHVTCIDAWLVTQPNCPVCRASVAGKRPSEWTVANNDDVGRDLADGAGLV